MGRNATIRALNVSVYVALRGRNITREAGRCIETVAGRSWEVGRGAHWEEEQETLESSPKSQYSTKAVLVQIIVPLVALATHSKHAHTPLD